jgi:CcmD family protein
VSQGQYVAAVYGVVFVVVLAYVAIIAAKLARLERQTAELLQLAAERRSSAGSEVPSGDPATSRIS